MTLLLIFGPLVAAFCLLVGYGTGYCEARKDAWNDGWEAHERLMRTQAREGLQSIGWKEWEDVVRPARRHDLTDLDLERRARRWEDRS